MRGFTLVELGAVVMIVSILAVIAVVSFKKLITSSHSAEATQIINSVRVAQEAYRAETGAYLDVSTGISVVTDPSTPRCNPGGNTYPSTAPGNFKTAWGASCTTGCNPGVEWTALPVHVDGPVMYGYTTKAGSPATAPPTGISIVKQDGTASALAFGTPTVDWFVIGACGDPDGDGVFSSYLGSSFSNEIFASNEGN